GRPAQRGGNTRRQGTRPLPPASPRLAAGRPGRVEAAAQAGPTPGRHCGTAGPSPPATGHQPGRRARRRPPEAAPTGTAPVANTLARSGSMSVSFYRDQARRLTFGQGEVPTVHPGNEGGQDLRPRSGEPGV